MHKEQFKKFTDLLLEWNKIHNLTGAKTPADVEKILKILFFLLLS
jgi:16S rRNA G527 N7-methylase RsmG